MARSLDASYLREAVAAVIYQNCLGRPWTTASPVERGLFLTGANQAIGLVIDAIERSLSERRIPANLN